MQLIRHTIEYINNQKHLGSGIIDSNRENMTEIIRVTPSYKLADRAKIIRLNQTKPLRHAYFREYRKLQELCLMILNIEKHGLGYQEQKIHGILFDVAWLWEEYVYTLLPKDFIHPWNKDKTDGVSVFSDRKRKVFPDFYNRELRTVLDAKYKKLEFTEKGIKREDLFQLISYSYILKADQAGLVFPSKEKVVDNEIGKLAGYGALLKKWSIQMKVIKILSRGLNPLKKSLSKILVKIWKVRQIQGRCLVISLIGNKKHEHYLFSVITIDKKRTIL